MLRTEAIIKTMTAIITRTCLSLKIVRGKRRRSICGSAAIKSGNYSAGAGIGRSGAGASGAGWWIGCVLSIQAMLRMRATNAATKRVPTMRERTAIWDTFFLFECGRAIADGRVKSQAREVFLIRRNDLPPPIALYRPCRLPVCRMKSCLSLPEALGRPSRILRSVTSRKSRALAVTQL